MFRKKEKVCVDMTRVPQHVAFIMDGNGRWAKKRGMPRTYGHKIGVESLRAVVRRAKELGIKVVSFFAFSTENWNRSKEEVTEIFRLCRELLEKKMQDYIDSDMRFCVIGDYSKIAEVDKDLVDEISNLISKTKDHTGMVVNVALNYGGRAEIVRACNKIIASGIKEVDEKTFAGYLDQPDLPDPDFVIRTSGENRVSNFMMWQMAYAELHFPKTYWPDFREKQLDEAIVEFQKRDRRFGGIKS